MGKHKKSAGAKQEGGATKTRGCTYQVPAGLLLSPSKAPPKITFVGIKAPSSVATLLHLLLHHQLASI